MLLPRTRLTEIMEDVPIYDVQILFFASFFSRMGKKIKKEVEPPPKDVVSFWCKYQQQFNHQF